MASYTVVEKVMENDEILSLIEKFCDKVLERGTLTDLVGSSDFDFTVLVMESNGDYFTAADIFSESEDFDVSKVKWDVISTWLIDELIDREFFIKLDDLMGIDAHKEKALCMSGGELVNDWGYGS